MCYNFGLFDGPIMETRDFIRFGNFVLDRTRGAVTDGKGAERFLRPKSYRLLEVLCRRRGELLSKDELVGEVWPNLFASDDSLAHCVSDIRRALGPEGANLLRTVPRRGYMLAAVEPEPKPEVLLPAIAGPWRVQAGGLAAVLLVGAALGSWSMLPRDPPAAGLVLATSPVQQANALLDARDWRRRENNELARALLENAVAEEPADPDALASLGLTYWLEVRHLAWGGGRREMERALELVELAVALGGSARAHRLLAEMRLLAPFPDKRSPLDALASARAAVTIDDADPDNLAVLAHSLALTGRSEAAVATIARALRLQPSPPAWHRQVAGLAYLLDGEPARAAEELGPLYGAGTFANERWWPGWLFAASLAHAGRVDEATKVIEVARQHRPERSVDAVAETFDGFVDEKGLRLVLNGLRLAGMPG